MVIVEEQSVMLMRDVYFRDLEKIARLIREVMVKGENLGWAGEFCNYRGEEMGIGEYVRAI